MVGCMITYGLFCFFFFFCFSFLYTIPFHFPFDHFGLVDLSICGRHCERELSPRSSRPFVLYLVDIILVLRATGV